jgi:hypothetical protein
MTLGGHMPIMEAVEKSTTKDDDHQLRPIAYQHDASMCYFKVACCPDCINRLDITHIERVEVIVKSRICFERVGAIEVVKM